MSQRQKKGNVIGYWFLDSYNSLTVIILSVLSFLLIVSNWSEKSGWIIVILSLSAILGFSGLLLWYKGKSKIIIKENEFGIVFYSNGNFNEFIDSGKYYYNPWSNELKANVSKNKLNSEFRLDNILTKEGIPITIYCNAEYRFNLDHIIKEQPLDAAYALLNLPSGKIVGLTTGILREVIEKKLIVEDLYKPSGQTVLNSLETEVTIIINDILNDDPLFLNDSYKAFLKYMELPKNLEVALLEAKKISFNNTKPQKETEKASVSLPDKIKLLDLIDEHFSENELLDLLFRFDRVKYENLPPGGKKDKIRELIKWTLRREHYKQLVLLIEELRPNLKLKWDGK